MRGAPRGASLGSSTVPPTPRTVPPSTVSSSTRCRNRSSTRPDATASLTRRANGATTPGPVPHVRWKRGRSCTDAPPSPRPGRAADPGRAATSASRRQRSPGTPRPTGAARRPRLGRIPQRPSSPSRQLARVADAQPALLRSVDEEEAAQRPPGLSTKVRARPAPRRSPAPGIGQLGGGDQAREAGTDHDDVSFAHGHGPSRVTPRPRGQPRRVPSPGRPTARDESARAG